MTLFFDPARVADLTRRAREDAAAIPTAPEAFPCCEATARFTRALSASCGSYNVRAAAVRDEVYARAETMDVAAADFSRVDDHLAHTFSRWTP